MVKDSKNNTLWKDCLRLFESLQVTANQSAAMPAEKGFFERVPGAWFLEKLWKARYTFIPGESRSAPAKWAEFLESYYLSFS